MKRKSKRIDKRDHVGDLLKNPPSNPFGPYRPTEQDIEEAKRRLDKLLAEMQQEWKTGVKLHVRRL